MYNYYLLKKKTYNKIFIVSILLLSFLIFQNIKLNKTNKTLISENETLVQKLEQSNETINSLKEKVDIILIDHNINKDNILSYIEPLSKLDKIEYLTQYKKIVEQYHYLFDEKSLENDFTKEQINIMLSCIETETYQANIEGKINVASVILNRIENKLFPSDPISVVTAPNQFAYHRTNISEETMLALEYAYIIGDTTNGCIGFRSDSAPNQWGRWTYQFTDIIGHNFYK